MLEDRLKRPSILLSALGGSGELAGLVLGAVATTSKLAALSFDAEADRLMEEWRSSQPREKSRKMMRK